MASIASLISWVNTFTGLEGAHANASDLVDGVALSEILSQLAPASIKLNLIKKDVRHNANLCVVNLKRLVSAIKTYYEDELGMSVQSEDTPDTSLIGENENIGELSKLIVLLLGIAVQCAGKEDYVRQIMNMNQEEQQTIMSAIQDLVTRGRRASSVADASSSSPSASAGMGGSSFEGSEERVRILEASNHSLEQSYQEAALKLRELQAELDQSLSDNSILKEQLLEFTSGNGSGGGSIPGTPAGKITQSLQQEVNLLRDRLDQAELLRDQYMRQSEDQQKTIVDLKHKAEVMAKENADAKSLQEEMAVLQQSAAKVSKLEGTIENLKKKLEDMTDLKQRLKELEERNNELTRQSTDREDEQAKYKALKDQVTMYQKQNATLSSQLTDVTFQLQQAKLDASNAKEQANLRAEEIRDLKGKLHELEERLQSAGSGVGLSLADSLGEGTGDASLASALSQSSNELLQRISKLEQQNKRLLQAQQSGNESEQSELLQSMLEEAKDARSKLEKDLVESQQKLHKLENERNQLQTKLEDAQKQQLRGGAESLAWQQLAESERSAKKYQADADDLRMKCDELERKTKMLEDTLSSSQHEVVELKKQHALLSMDKQELVDQLKAEHAKELEEKLSEAVKALKDEVEKLLNENRELSASIQPMINAQENIEIKYNNVVQMRDELQKHSKEQTERINLLLTEKVDFLDNIRKLEAQLASKDNSNSNSVELESLRREIDRERTRAMQIEKDLSRKDVELEDSKSKLGEMKGRLEVTSSQLSQKTQDIEKLQNFLSEAKTIIHDLKQKSSNSTASGENSELSAENKKRLEEKEAEVDELKRKLAKSKEERLISERHMTTAWYTLSLKLQQIAVNERLNAKSFLARQRANLTGRIGDS